MQEKLEVLVISLAVAVKVFCLIALRPLIECRRLRRTLASRRLCSRRDGSRRLSGGRCCSRRCCSRRCCSRRLLPWRLELTQEEFKILVIGLAVAVKVFGFRALQPLIKRWNRRRHLTAGRLLSRWRCSGRCCSGRCCSRRCCSRRCCSRRCCSRRCCSRRLLAGRLGLSQEKLEVFVVRLAVAVEVFCLIALRPLIECRRLRRTLASRRLCSRRDGSRRLSGGRRSSPRRRGHCERETGFRTRSVGICDFD